VQKLKRIPIKEWGLFDNFQEHEIVNQIQFLTDMLINTQPKKILEIGTNHSYFVYLASCIIPGVKIETVDTNKNASIGVDILKNIGVNVIFHNKKSSEFFKDFNEAIDFAWIDGSHAYEDCLQDLLSCAELNASVICVDDVRSDINVLKAVFDFYRASAEYKVIGQSYIFDHRGIICFKKF
jgi:predicted O-methyltransferase YrrM